MIAKNTLLAVCTVVLLLGLTAVALMEMERERPPSVRAEELSYLPKGEYLRIAVLGYREMAADLIWLRVVQHLGARRPTKGGYLWAYHAVDVVTDLDPNFYFAYEAGGVNLGVWGGLLYESIEILKKGLGHGMLDGMEQNPQVWRKYLWRLPFFIGYDYFYELCDPKKAAPFFQTAAGLPNAPAYLPRLAVRMRVAGGDPEAALEFLQQFYQQTQDQRLREALLEKMKQVVAERDIRFLEESVGRYKSQYGKKPTSLGDLVRARIIRTIPDEPYGGSYQFNVTDGRVTATGLRERLQIYRNTVNQGCQLQSAEPAKIGGFIAP